MATKKRVIGKEVFDSIFQEKYALKLPEFTGMRVMMMPVLIGDSASLPEFLADWRKTFEEVSAMADESVHGQVGYITIDEKTVGGGATHRRAGAHVDGVYQGSVGGWGGGRTGGGWGGVGNGMLTVSNITGCRAWNKTMQGWPGWEGECDHLLDQLPEAEAVVFKPNVVYWLDGLCVHESIPQPKVVDRQFVRLSLPSEGPWFEGYTENPMGIKPTGPILPPRVFMSA